MAVQFVRVIHNVSENNNEYSRQNCCGHNKWNIRNVNSRNELKFVIFLCFVKCNYTPFCFSFLRFQFRRCGVADPMNVLNSDYIYIREDEFVVRVGVLEQKTQIVVEEENELK